MNTKELRNAPIAVRVRPSLKDELSELARADRRSLAAYLEVVLEDHVMAKKPDEAKRARKSGRPQR